MSLGAAADAPGTGELSALDAARIAVAALLLEGVRYVVVAPGSRSAPMAYALAEADAAGRVELLVRIDERDAGFTALGLALATGAPAAVLTTSGTAVGNLLPAVMEANHAAVPLVVISADRPEELRGTGANQTTVQLDLFGEHVRFAADVPAGSDPRRAVETALSAATGAFEDTPPGPVQLNLAFRDPLVPAPGDRLPPESGRRVYRARPRSAGPRFPARLVRPAGTAHRGAGRARRRSGRRSVRPGPRPAPACRAVLQRAVRAERGGTVPDCPGCVRPRLRAADRARGALRPAHPLPARERPAGPRRRPLSPLPASARGLVRAGPPHRTPARQPGGPGRLRRPRLHGVARCLAPGGAAAQHAVDVALAGSAAATGPAVGALVWEQTRGQLVLGSSNGIRDVDLAGAPAAEPGAVVFANRGLSGIDGTLATATGIALGGRQETTVLLGDVTFLHDAGGLLLGAGEEEPNLRIVVLNDAGGAIFGLLEHGAVEAAGRYGTAVERLFGTPHSVNLAALAAAYGVAHRPVSTTAELAGALAEPWEGRSIIEVRTDRRGLRELHMRIRAAVGAAVAGVLAAQ